jgi:predicted nucleotide-binding protein
MPYYYFRIYCGAKLAKKKRWLGSYNLSEESLKKYYVEPYLNNEEFMIRGRRVNPRLIEIIQVYKNDKRVQDLSCDLSVSVPVVLHRIVKGEIGKQVTRAFISYPPGKQFDANLEKVPKTFSRNIFIVHGKEDQPKLELARMLEELKFGVTMLSEKPDSGRTLIEKLEKEASDIGYAFVILTPDDVGMEKESFERMLTHPEERQKTEFCYRARQNVILELGYFVGKIGRNRVCCLYQGNIELPSDVNGVVYKRFKESLKGCFEEIVKELKAAGYSIDI